MTPTVILITTACEDLSFLVPVVERIVDIVGPRLEHFRIFDDEGIVEVMQRLRDGGHEKVIIFSHGRDGELLGADSPGNGSHGMAWLDKSSQLSILNEKEVFCLACQSFTVGIEAVKHGAKAFLGFSEVPFQRFEGDNPRYEPYLENACKQAIAHAAQLAILKWLVDHSDLREVMEYFRLCVRQNALEFARNEKDHPLRKEVVRLNLDLLKCSLRTG